MPNDRQTPEPARRRAFTLVELLVVITIIVLLIALLIPAMDRAMYQGELAACGAKLRTIATSATTYAMSNNRTYPARDGVRLATAWYPFELSYPGYGVDERPSIVKAMDINKTLNDPAAGTADMVNIPSSLVVSSYSLWFSWRYHVYAEDKGMSKLGDRWTWAGRDYDVIASDHDRLWASSPGALTSHADDWSVMYHYDVQDANIVCVRWQNLTQVRGPVTLNYAYQDSSVRRFDAVKSVDDRTILVPDRTDNAYPADWWDTVPTQ